MKRDARIGLAVVLVLGLGVTLLVGRALYKRGGNSADFDGEQLALSDGSSQTGRVDPATAAPADANLFGSRDDARPNIPPVTGITPQSPIAGSVPPSAEGFIKDQTSAIEPKAPVAPPKRSDHATPVGEPDDSTNAQPTSTRGRKSESSGGANEYFAYTVTNGDSPWSISSKIFGDGKYTQKIVEANDLTAKKMKPGMTLKIPSIANKAMVMKLQPYNESGSTKATHDVASSKPAPANTTGENRGTPSSSKGGGYKVEAGDTLSTIAKKHYGSNGPKTIQMIISANHGLDPTKLKVGQEIALPAAK